MYKNEMCLSDMLSHYCRRDLELNRSNSAVSMSCDTSDYSYAQYGQTSRVTDNMTELLEEPVEEKQEQVSPIYLWYVCPNLMLLFYKLLIETEIKYWSVFNCLQALIYKFPKCAHHRDKRTVKAIKIVLLIVEQFEVKLCTKTFSFSLCYWK